MAIRRDLSVGVWETRAVVETLSHSNFAPNVVFEPLEPYIYIYIFIYIYIYRERERDIYILSVPSTIGGHGRLWEASWRPRDTIEAGSRAQIVAWPTESNPLTTPPRPRKLHLLGEVSYICTKHTICI